MEAHKWKGKASVEVKGITADQVWSLLADFCNLQKCMPNIDQCVKLEGEDGKPGLVRHIRHHVTTTDEEEKEEEGGEQQQPPLSPDEEQPVSVHKKNGGVWANEKLLMIDETARFLSYELIDNSLGMKSYEAAFRAEAADGEGEVARIEWSYVADPIEGVKIEDFEVTRSYLLQAMVEKIQAHFSVTDPVPVVSII